MAKSNIKIKLAKKQTTPFKKESKLQRSGGSVSTPKLKRRGCCGRIK